MGHAGEVAFVLPAGGPAGAAQVGMLRALLDAGVTPDVLVGCSVGALNAAFLAIDPTPARARELEVIWRAITRSDVFGPPRPRTVLRIALGHDHVFDPLPLRMLITRFCPIADLSATAVPVHVVTTDLDHGISRWWVRGPAHEILYASACLPGLFAPAHLDGQRHVDGGVLEPVPVSRAVDLDVDTVYVLGDLEQPGPPLARRASAMAVLIRSFTIARYARLPESTSLGRAGQRVVVIPSPAGASADLRDFSRTDRLIAGGYDAASAVVPGRLLASGATGANRTFR